MYIDNLTFFIMFLPLVYGYKFPETFKRCHLNDPSLDSCLRETIENAFQIIGDTGLPSLNIPPIDPVEISSIEIGAGTSAVNLVQKYHNVKVFGFSKIKVNDSHYDIEKKILKFVSLHPEIRQEAKYDVNGKILVIPVFGNGDSTITLRDATVEHTVIFKEKTKKNKSYFNVPSYEVKIQIKGAHFDFKNLFNGDEKLANNILTVVNENWNVLFEDVKEGVEKSYGEVFKSVTNGFFGSIPIEEIFLS